VNPGAVSGFVTAVLILLFVGIVFWAYGPRRRKRFDAAARMPLEEDHGPGERKS
jgi:cytochrome c oxidase cbb3-type subunit 4